VALVAVTALSIPVTRVWLTGIGATYEGVTDYSTGSHAMTVPPVELSASDLASIAAGEAPVEPLDRLLGYVSERPHEFGLTIDPPMELAAWLVDQEGMADSFRTRGFPIALWFGRGGREFETVRQLNAPPPTMERDGIETRLTYTTLSYQNADPFCWRILHVWHTNVLGLVGAGLLVTLLVFRLFRRASLRITALGLVLLAVCVQSVQLNDNRWYSFSNSSAVALQHSGHTVRGALKARGDEHALRRLAGDLRDALPSDENSGKIIRLGARAPVHMEFVDTVLGPPLAYFGNYSSQVGHHLNSDGTPDTNRPARFGDFPLVRMANQSPMLTWTRGNRLYSFHAHTGNILFVLVLLAYCWVVPAWVLGILARRRARLRARGGLCAGCGYDLNSVGGGVLAPTLRA